MVKWEHEGIAFKLDLDPVVVRIWDMQGYWVWEIYAFNLKGKVDTKEQAMQEGEAAAQEIADTTSNNLKQLQQSRDLNLGWMVPGALAEYRGITGKWYKCKILEEPTYSVIGDSWAVLVGGFVKGREVLASNYDVQPRGPK